MSLVSKEFSLSDDNFNQIREIVIQHAGIVLSDAKRDMVYSRLVRRLRRLNIKDFDHYCAILEDQNHEEFTHFINAITTNLTSFFRENHHFEILAETALPEIMHRNRLSKSLRVWSAGCSTGMETYSIAMVLKEVIPDSLGWDVKILATDLDTNVIDTASKGIYEIDRVTGVSNERMARWFMRGPGEHSDKVKVSKELRDMVTFKQLNLLQPFPFKGPIDIIFCRNVVIYFDKNTQKDLFDKFADIHADDSYLFIGHSETLYNVTDRYKLLHSTVYKKTK